MCGMEVQAKSKQGTPVNWGGNSQMDVRKTKLAEINVGRKGNGGIYRDR